MKASVILTTTAVAVPILVSAFIVPYPRFAASRSIPRSVSRNIRYMANSREQSIEQLQQEIDNALQEREELRLELEDQIRTFQEQFERVKQKLESADARLVAETQTFQEQFEREKKSLESVDESIKRQMQRLESVKTEGGISEQSPRAATHEEIVEGAKQSEVESRAVDEQLQAERKNLEEEARLFQEQLEMDKKLLEEDTRTFQERFDSKKKNLADADADIVEKMQELERLKAGEGLSDVDASSQAKTERIIKSEDTNEPLAEEARAFQEKAELVKKNLENADTRLLEELRTFGDQFENKNRGFKFSSIEASGGVLEGVLAPLAASFVTAVVVRFALIGRQERLEKQIRLEAEADARQKFVKVPFFVVTTLAIGTIGVWLLISFFFTGDVDITSTISKETPGVSVEVVEQSKTRKIEDVPQVTTQPGEKKATKEPADKPNRSMVKLSVEKPTEKVAEEPIRSITSTVSKETPGVPVQIVEQSKTRRIEDVPQVTMPPVEKKPIKEPADRSNSRMAKEEKLSDEKPIEKVAEVRLDKEQKPPVNGLAAQEEKKATKEPADKPNQSSAKEEKLPVEKLTEKVVDDPNKVDKEQKPPVDYGSAQEPAKEVTEQNVLPAAEKPITGKLTELLTKEKASSEIVENKGEPEAGEAAIKDGTLAQEIIEQQGVRIESTAEKSSRSSPEIDQASKTAQKASKREEEETKIPVDITERALSKKNEVLDATPDSEKKLAGRASEEPSQSLAKDGTTAKASEKRNQINELPTNEMFGQKNDRATPEKPIEKSDQITPKDTESSVEKPTGDHHSITAMSNQIFSKSDQITSKDAKPSVERPSEGVRSIAAKSNQITPDDAEPFVEKPSEDVRSIATKSNQINSKDAEPSVEKPSEDQSSIAGKVDDVLSKSPEEKPIEKPSAKKLTSFFTNKEDSASDMTGKDMQREEVALSTTQGDATEQVATKGKDEVLKGKPFEIFDRQEMNEKSNKVSVDSRDVPEVSNVGDKSLTILKDPDSSGLDSAFAKAAESLSTITEALSALSENTLAFAAVSAVLMTAVFAMLMSMSGSDLVATSAAQPNKSDATQISDNTTTSNNESETAKNIQADSASVKHAVTEETTETSESLTEKKLIPRPPKTPPPLQTMTPMERRYASAAARSKAASRKPTAVEPVVPSDNDASTSPSSGTGSVSYDASVAKSLTPLERLYTAETPPLSQAAIKRKGKTEEILAQAKREVERQQREEEERLRELEAVAKKNAQVQRIENEKRVSEAEATANVIRAFMAGKKSTNKSVSPKRTDGGTSATARSLTPLERKYAEDAASKAQDMDADTSKGPEGPDNQAS